LARTKGRNAILIFLAPRSQKFSLFGDVAVHQKFGAEFWQTLRDEILPYLKAGQYTAAIVQAITKAGEKLSEHFPPEGKSEPERNAEDEVPDKISRD
jgi:uncharacterized membrane protein